MIKMCLAIMLLVFTLESSNAYANEDAKKIQKNSVVILLDTSNSMHTELGGAPKVKTAQKLLEKAIPNIAKNVDVRLAMYGRDPRHPCLDMNYLSDFSVNDDRADIVKALRENIVKRDRYPIEQALSPAVFAAEEGHANGGNHLLVITDGLEACTAVSVCGIARRLKLGNPRLHIHLIGVDIDRKAYRPKEIACVPVDGDGLYQHVESNYDFKEALDKVIALVEKEEPEPPEPAVYNVAYEESFDSHEALSAWRIESEVKDRYRMDSGALILKAPENADKDDKEPKNIFILKDALPKGDWKATARVHMDLDTAHEAFEVGAIDKDGKRVSAMIRMLGFAPPTLILANEDKRTEKVNLLRIYLNVLLGWQGAKAFSDEKMPFDLTFIKEGDQFKAHAVSVNSPRYIYETAPLPFSTQDGHLYFNLYQKPKDPHMLIRANKETVARIEWIKLETKQ